MSYCLTINPTISNRKTFISETKRITFNINFVLYLSIVLTLVFLLTYIFQIQTIIKEKYLIENYKTNIEKYTREIGMLEINLLSSNSLEIFEEKTKEHNFVKIDKIKYLPIPKEYLVRQ